MVCTLGGITHAPDANYIRTISFLAVGVGNAGHIDIICLVIYAKQMGRVACKIHNPRMVEVDALQSCASAVNCKLTGIDDVQPLVLRIAILRDEIGNSYKEEVLFLCAQGAHGEGRWIPFRSLQSIARD